MLGAVPEMAKKRGKAGRPSQPEPERVDFIRVRVSGAWKGWLGRFADAKQLTMSDLINQAVIKYAEDEGFEAPPKR